MTTSAEQTDLESDTEKTRNEKHRQRREMAGLAAAIRLGSEMTFWERV